MKESYLQALYDCYHQESQDSGKRKEVMSKLHRYVYEYATRRFGAESDMSSAFYMKMYDRIQTLLDKYDPKYKISFFIYFSVILKRNYVKFFSEVSKKEKIYSDFYDWESQISGESNQSQNTSQEQEKKEDQNEARKLIEEAMSFLNMNQHIALRLNFWFLPIAKASSGTYDQTWRATFFLTLP